MQGEDRKLGWALVFALTVIAIELAWILFIGPADNSADQTAKQEAEHLFLGLPAEAWTALFTGVLTAGTILLWWQTRRLAEGAEGQAAQLERSLTAAQKTADAAELSAKAAIGVELPFLHLERVEGTPLPDGDRMEWIKTFHPKITIKNYGRTPAFVTRVVINLLASSSLPRQPAYKIVDRWPDPAVIDARQPWEYTEFLLKNEEALSPDDIAAICEAKSKYLDILGYVDFKDFLGREYRFGFAYFMNLEMDAFLLEPNSTHYNYQRLKNANDT